MADLGDRTLVVSQILGTTTETIGKLNAISAVTGTSLEAIQFSMSRLALNLDRAQIGAGQAGDAIHALGLNARELLQLNTEQRLNVIADAFANFQNGAVKSEIGLELFGRGAPIVACSPRVSTPMPQVQPSARFSHDQAKCFRS
jgi:hypothetical protein